MSTNLYGKSCTPNLGGVQDFYTKSEVNQFLLAKANTSTTYIRSYIDNELSDLSDDIASLSLDKIDQTQLDASLATLQSTIESDSGATYATLTSTYNKTEVDSLIDAIDLDPTDYIRSSPATTSQNTIYPGTEDAIALTVRGSSTNAIVFRWLDSSSNLIGYISNDSSTTLNGTLSLGQLTSSGSAALDVNGRRITSVGSPVHASDAVSYSTLQTYVADFYTDLETGGNFQIDAGTYPNTGEFRQLYRHLRSSVLFQRPSQLDILDGEIAVNYNTDSLGLFIEDSAGKIRKIGPAYVGSSSPTPSSLSNGEMWIDNLGPEVFLKYYDESKDEWVGLVTPFKRDISETRLIRLNATLSIGVAGTVPFGVGPVIPPGMNLVGIGPDSYNVIDVYSGSVS